MWWAAQLIVVCAGGLVEIGLALGVLSLSAHTYSTGLVSWAYQFLGVFHMLLISFCVSSLVFCFLVTVSPSTYIEMCRTLFTQAHSKGTLSIVAQNKKDENAWGTVLCLSTFEELSSVVCSWHVSQIYCHLLSIIGYISFWKATAGLLLVPLV